MIHRSRYVTALTLALLAAGAALPAAVSAQGADVNALITELQGGSPAQTRTPEQELAAYTQVLDSLLPHMADVDLNKRGDAQDKWEKIALRAARPGGEADRMAASRAMLSAIKPDVALESRRWMLKQLENIGRAEAVPTLVTLLGDPEPLIREGARRALTNNASPEAVQALRTALAAATAPDLRIALINSLNYRKDAASLATLAKSAQDPDAKVATAAIAAISAIGGANALQTLSGLKGTVPADQRKYVLDALLLTADQLVKQGNGAQADAIYQALYVPAEPKLYRIAALRGLVVERGARAVPLITQVLAGNDNEMRLIASRLIGEVPGTAVTTAFAAALPNLPAAGQIALLDELGVRGDAAARADVVGLAKGADANVQLSALRALGAVGNANDVMFLALTAATGQGAVRDTARESLARLRGAAINDALIKGLTGGDAKVRTELVHALSARHADQAVTPLVAVLNDPDTGVRTEAVNALGTLGNAQVLPSLVALVGRTRDDNQRGTLVNAISAIVSNLPDKTAGAAPVLAALQGADAATQLSLLPVLKLAGGAGALDAVRADVKSANAEVAGAAVRTLADWPDVSAASDLLQIARTDPDETHQVLALRGYVRLVGASDRAPADKLKMYRDAMAVARRPDEKRLVLGGLGDVTDPDALKYAASFLTDNDLREEAASAAVKIAKNVGGAAGPDLKPLMRQIIATSKNEGTTKAATEVISLADISLRGWQVLGPFPVDNMDVAFNKDFGPEKGVDINQGYPGPDGKTLHWRPVTIDPTGLVALEKQLNPHDNAAAYALVYVKSPDARKAIMSVGSDDGVKAWINGKQVIATNTSRAATPDQDEASVDLKAGWNEVLLKITQGGGEWGYYFDLLDPQKKPMTDLVYGPKPQG